MATRKKGKRSKPPQQLLAEVIASKGSGQAVARELRPCSQQSVSAWVRYVSLPRARVQAQMQKLYGIPMPWPPLPARRT